LSSSIIIDHDDGVRVDRLDRQQQQQEQLLDYYTITIGHWRFHCYYCIDIYCQHSPPIATFKDRR
jgi:hypothetical protein